MTTLSTHLDLITNCIIPVTAPLENVTLPSVEWFEVRFDLIPQGLWTKTIDCLKGKKLCYTLRRKIQGGNFSNTVLDQFETLKSLINYHKPDLIDLDVDLPIEEFRVKWPSIQLLISNHVSNHIGWEGALNALLKHTGDFYKCACPFTTTTSMFEFLSRVKQLNQNKKVWIPLVLGEKGNPSRILAAHLGSPFVYLALNRESSLYGQITYQEWVDNYQTNCMGVLYGLLGSPIHLSYGHITHNQFFQKRNQKGLYLKLEVLEKEFSLILPLLKEFGFKGFSVTMPLKKIGLTLATGVDELAAKTLAVNTLKLDGEVWKGYNTDMEAFSTLLAEPILKLEKREAVILGTGAIAFGVAYVLCQLGVKVTLIGRNKIKTEKLADQLGCSWSEWHLMEKVNKTILVQATPIGMGDGKGFSFPEEMIPKKGIVIDFISNPKVTPLLKKAKEVGAMTISGYELFVKQAELQNKIWFSK
ncbi:type I 3-dehydroquinate dehydratase [Chlamydiales bacterium]|nr:type I 3-dehydroquinate dehydratase [Chlamydiales bacterium]